MPAQSQAQQKFMGVVHAAQQGKAHPTGAAKKVAIRMNPKDVTDFASTPHKGLPQHVEESSQMIMERMKSNVEFWAVIMPEDHTPSMDEIVKHFTPIEFAEAWGGGQVAFNEIEGFYLSEEEAYQAAQGVVKGLYESAKGLEAKKEVVAKKLQKKIDELDREAQKHLKMAKQDPENSEKHRATAKALLAKVDELESKSKTVKGSKKELQPLEEFEMPKKSK